RDQANTFAAAQTMPAILARMVMPLTVSAYAVSSNVAVTLTVNDLWVQYWVPSTFTCILTLPPLSTVADGHTIFLMAIAGNSATLKGDGSENIDASDGGFANTATISGSKFALYLCRADTASARWRLIKLT